MDSIRGKEREAGRVMGMSFLSHKAVRSGLDMELNVKVW